MGVRGDTRAGRTRWGKEAAGVLFPTAGSEAPGRGAGWGWSHALVNKGRSSPSRHRVRGFRSLERAPLTIPIDVHGAGVALPVVVRVDLRRVVHVGAVVTSVPDLVFVVVELTGVEEKLAVVLEKNRGKNSRNSVETLAGLLITGLGTYKSCI